MNKPLPSLAIVLGVAGLIPFAVLGVFALGQGADRSAIALCDYAAVILTFLGGVHWGFALAEPAGAGERARLGLGVVPSLVGWVGLLLVTAVGINAGLVVLILGFIGTIMVERRAAEAGLMPPGYLGLRYALSAAVLGMLVLVLVLRALGVQIGLSSP